MNSSLEKYIHKSDVIKKKKMCLVYLFGSAGLISLLFVNNSMYMVYLTGFRISTIISGDH